MKEEKYTTKDFELAIKAKNYELLSVHKRHSSNVTYAIGLVPVIKKVSPGNYVPDSRKVRWESDGRCFIPRSSKRLRQYDIKFKS